MGRTLNTLILTAFHLPHHLLPQAGQPVGPGGSEKKGITMQDISEEFGFVLGDPLRISLNAIEEDCPADTKCEANSKSNTRLAH